jgi:hypothetical protein
MERGEALELIQVSILTDDSRNSLEKRGLGKMVQKNLLLQRIMRQETSA